MKRTTKPEDMSNEDWLMKHVVKNEVTGCWNFTRGVPSSKAGYRRLCFDGLYQYTHRWSYQNFIGPIPNGRHVAHKCDNPQCCNPEHLYAATPKENTQDSIKRMRRPTKWNMTPKDKVERVIRLLQRGIKGYKVAQKTGASNAAVSCIRTGRTHRDVLPNIMRPIRAMLRVQV